MNTRMTCPPPEVDFLGFEEWCDLFFAIFLLFDWVINNAFNFKKRVFDTHSLH